MKNVGHIIVCDEVFNSPNGEFIIKQPLNMVVSPVLPTLYSFVISCGLINLEPEKKYNALIKLISPSKKILFENSFDFDISLESTKGSLSAAGYNINCRNIYLEEAGDYIVSVDVGEDHSELILPVAAVVRE